MVDLEQKLRAYDFQDGSGISYKTLQSHFMQIYLTIKLKARDVLEIGILRKMVSCVLNQYCNLTTLDFQKEYNPDLVIDITDLKQLDTLENNAYDLILLCQVLEHIPYEKIDGILRILEKKTRRYLIISVPNHTTYINLVFFNHSSRIIFKTLKDYFNSFFIKIEKLISRLDYIIRKKYKKFIPNKTVFTPHYWILGVDKFDVNSFKELLKKYFILIREERLRSHPFHHFFVLKKK